MKEELNEELSGLIESLLEALGDEGLKELLTDLRQGSRPVATASEQALTAKTSNDGELQEEGRTTTTGDGGSEPTVHWQRVIGDFLIEVAKTLRAVLSDEG